MKTWEDPKIWKLAAEYTEGSLTGVGEDHERVNVNIGGQDISLWGNNPSG